MALDTVNEAVRLGQLSPLRDSQTETLKLYGGTNYSPTGSGHLQQEYGLAIDVASYLNRAYGDRATQVAQLARAGYGERLAAGHPYLEAEVIYGATHEFARSSADILARRTRLYWLDQQATLAAIPLVAELMAKTLGWNEAERRADIAAATDYLS